MEEIKIKIYNELLAWGFKNYIILSYPMENYPNEEKLIKEHLKSFIEKLRKTSKIKIITYLYIYELHKKEHIQIHVLSNIELDKQLFKLKDFWKKIIGIDNEQVLNFQKVDENILEIYSDYILKLLNKSFLNKEISERQILLKKLGVNSRLFGGSKEFKEFLKEISGSIIEIPITFEKPEDAQSLDHIVNLLSQNYPEVTRDQIEEEITIELKNYTDAFDLIKYQNLEDFLKKGRSKISKGYLKFYNFIKEIWNTIIIDFKDLLQNWYKKKERKNYIVKILIDALSLDKDVSAENYRLLIITSLDYLIKTSLRGINLSIVSYQLGKLLVKNSKWDINNELNQKDYRKIGMILIMVFKTLLKKHYKLSLDITIIDEEELEESIYDIVDEIVENEDQQMQRLSLDTEFIEIVKEKKKLTKEVITNYITLTHPMILKPKDWQINQKNKIVENNISLYDTSQITTGGYLLNNYYFKKELQKNFNKGHLHKLLISEDCIKTINKIQKVSYIVNKDLLELLEKNKESIPDYKRSEEIKKLYILRKEQIKLKKELYNEKNNLVNLKANLCPINEKLQMVKGIIEDISSKITKNEVFQRVLLGFSDIKSYTEFYYSYDLDFRMRLYPQQVELSPQGSKLSRSLIKFKEKFKFNFDEFMFYSTRLYKKIYEFNENQLIVIFKSKIEPILKQFILDEKSVIKKIFEEAAEPYLFLSAAIEYKKYKEAELKGEDYYTGYPIILDCSGSGPQILSLLFLMEDFSKYLNLEPNEERKDFYIAVISKFLEISNIKIRYFKDNLTLDEEKELLIILRSCCKNVIMTQVYGVSYYNVRNTLQRTFKEKEEKLKIYLQENIIYTELISSFTNEFWKYLLDLPLFKLREFFLYIINNLSKADKELSWTVLSNSKVSINYQKHITAKLDFKENILGRMTHTHKEVLNQKNFKKMNTSAQANYIHSIDAAINMYILEKHKSSIFPIHDAWGVGMGQSIELQNSVKEIYHKIATDNFVLKKLISDFVKIISDTVSVSAGLGFKEYCEKNIELGNYNPNWILLCKFMAYYG